MMLVDLNVKRYPTFRTYCDSSLFIAAIVRAVPRAGAG